MRIERALNNCDRYQGQQNIFTMPGFRRALAQEYRLESVDIGIDSVVDAEAAVAETSAKTRWLPGYLKKTLFSQQLIIGADFDQSGLTAQLSHEHFMSVMNTLSETAGAHNIQQLQVRTQHAIPCQTDHADKVELAIRLDVSCEERLRQFSKSTRRNLRLPFKHGFHYVIGREQQQLDDFYRVYLLCMHELGSLAHSKAFFTALWQDCHEQIEIFVGYMDDQPVATSFHFLNGDEIYGAWGCGHPQYKKYSVFLAMLWQILQHCEASGRSCYNLGRSSLNSNAYQFKKRLANQERRIHYYRLPTSDPESNSQPSAIYRAASRLIHNSPPQVMQVLSRALLHRFY